MVRLETVAHLLEKEAGGRSGRERVHGLGYKQLGGDRPIRVLPVCACRDSMTSLANFISRVLRCALCSCAVDMAAWAHPAVGLRGARVPPRKAGGGVWDFLWTKRDK